MKNQLLSIGLLFFAVCTSAQNAEKILQQSYDKCQGVQNGHYEMTRFSKYMDNKDTTEYSFTCSFKKLTDDTLFSSAFHYDQSSDDTTSSFVMYTGEELVYGWSGDKVATITPKSKWAERIASISHNYSFFRPLMNTSSFPLPKSKSLQEEELIFKFIKEEKVKGKLCYHVQVNVVQKPDTTEMIETLDLEYHYWINKADMLPIQYSISYELYMAPDTLYQYDMYRLDKYEVNNLKDDKILTLESIPSDYESKQYEPYVRPVLLENGSQAPNWDLPSLTDEQVSLESLKGELVLVDFFYKSCYPCLLAIPHLQSLYEKYKDKGLQVVGIDPYDDKVEDDLVAFMAKRGVTYTVLLDGEETAKDYHVSAFPSLYLIDKSGKIIFSSEGFGDETEVELEKEILKHL